MQYNEQVQGQDVQVAHMDPWILGIASVAAFLALIGSIITCLCCGKRNGNNRNGDSRSISGGDTMPLEDLLSKPALTDPESVFSEFQFDGRLGSNKARSSNETGDEAVTTSSVSSSPMSEESVDECQKQTSGKKSSKKYRKDISSKSELNNSQASYSKLSGKSGTLQNELNLSNTTNKIQNKIESNKKANDALQKENASRKKKNTNRREDLGRIDEAGNPQNSKATLEVLTVNRISSGSESVSFSSSARGSVSHDIGTSANAFRLPRHSIYPRPEGIDDSRKGSRKEDDDDVHILPHVIVSPVDKDVNGFMNESDVHDTVVVINEESDDTKATSLHRDLVENSKSMQHDQNTKSSYSDEIQNEKSFQKDQFHNSKAKRLQTACSFDSCFHEQQHGRLPERISLNVQIDFHFPNQAETLGERALPIVVCSSMSGRDESSPQVVTSVPNKHEGTLNETECRKPPVSTNDELSIAKKESDPEVKPLNSSIILNPNVQDLRQRGISYLTPEMPAWVKSRLSVPLDFYKWRDTINKSPNLKRRSFTVADFQTLTFQSVKEIRAKRIGSNSENTDDLNKQNNKIVISIEKLTDDPSVTSNITENCVEQQVENPEEVQAGKHEKVEVEDPEQAKVENAKEEQVETPENPNSQEINTENDEAKREDNISSSVPKEDSIPKDPEDLPLPLKSITMVDDSCAKNSQDTLSVTAKDTTVEEPVEEDSCPEHQPSVEEEEQSAADKCLKSPDISTTDDKSPDISTTDDKSPDISTTDDKSPDISTTDESQRGNEMVIQSQDDNNTDCQIDQNDTTCQTDDNSETLPTEIFEKSQKEEESQKNIMEDRQCEKEPCIKSSVVPNKNESKEPNNNLSTESISDGAFHEDNADQMKCAKSSTSLQGKHESGTKLNEFLTKSSSCEFLPSSAPLSVAKNDGTELTSNTFPKTPSRQKHNSADHSVNNSITNSINNSTDNSIDNSIDTNNGSDDSDYDNPWDNLDNAVKRASMKYHKRPSVAACRARELMLKSAEDLGRLIELADKRRRDRLNSTKSTCHEIGSNESSPVFNRITPLRHTVKGLVSHKSSERVDAPGKRLGRYMVGAQSLRKSRDDIDQSLQGGENTKLSKSRKLYSPEVKKKNHF